MNNKTESEAKGVELTEVEKETIIEFEAGADAEGIILYVEKLLASQKTALKEAVIKAIPKPTMTGDISGYKLGCEVGRNEAIAEFTKSVSEAFKEAGK